MPRRMKSTGGWGVSIQGMDEVHDGLEAMMERFDDMQSYTVVSNVEYAVYVEFGTYKMPANGALRAAVQDALANLDRIARGADDADEITRQVAEYIRDGWKEDVWVDTGRLKRSIHVERVRS